MKTVARLLAVIASACAFDGARPTFDVILYGATGFTGRLAAEYLDAKYANGDVKWALAGRSRAKLEALAADLTSAPPLVVADAGDAAAVDAMVAQTSVVANFAGTPFLTKALPVVEACARRGVGYVDITGEVALMRASLDRFDAVARESGAKIVHGCGYDSVPSDVGYLMAADAYRERYGAWPERVRLVDREKKGGASGGSIHTGLALFGYDYAGGQDAAAAAAIAAVKGKYPLNDVCGPDAADTVLFPEYDAVAESYVVPFIMATVNAPVVRKTMALLGRPYSAYSEVTASPSARSAWTSTLAAYAGLAALVVPPLRYLIVEYALPKPGDGPDLETRTAGYFKSETYATGPHGTTRARMLSNDCGDYGYKCTAQMAVEAALTLALEKVPAGGGVLTPAAAMGAELIGRLRASGMSLTVDGA